MTREEAKNIVAQQLSGLLSNPLVTLYEKYVEAEKMAIEALEQESCEDCVSREYVIKLLENTKRTRKEITNRIYEVPSVTPQPNKWIPCSERLPEKRGCYIVTEKVFSLDDREHKGRYNTMVEQVEYYDGKWKRASFFEVVAWMPLPEPYKEESEDNG